MLKLVTISLLLIGFGEAAISSIQLVIPDDTYSVLAVGKSSTSALDNSLSSLSNALSEEDKTSNEVSEESNESAAASSASSQSLATDSTESLTTGPSSVPAALTRVKPSSATSSAITTTSGVIRGSLLISTSAQALPTTANSPAIPLNTTSPISLIHSTATVQHRILPAETIPLPITISTRSGLRTVIAPETITIQQPAIAKVGEIVQQIPTAVSHQQQTVVHNHARVVTPIVAPAIRTVTSQIVRAYHTPLVYAPHVVEN